MSAAPRVTASTPSAPVRARDEQARRRRTPVRRRRWPASLAWHLGALALLGVIGYPLAWLVIGSVKPGTEIVTSLTLWPSRVEFGNYVKAADGIAGVGVGRFFVNSTILAVGSVVGVVVSCSLAAYAFAKLRFRLRGPLFAFMIGTILLPHHVLLIPQYTLFQRLGLVDTYVPLLLGKFLAVDAFFVFLMVQFMRTLPAELDDAARIDGCGHWGVFRHVALPLSRPALVTTSIFTFIWSWNEFFQPLIYISSPEKFPLPLALRLFLDETRNATNYGGMIALSVLALIPVLLFFLAFQRLLIEGVQTSGLRG